MAKDPAILFYSGDFLTGVADLTMEERGQYITLLCLSHQKHGLTKKTIQISCPNVSKDVMAKFFEKDGLFFNERLENEREKRTKHSKAQSDNAKKRWNPKSMPRHSDGIAVAMPLENENENENRNRNRNEKEKIALYPSFNDFWNSYQKKRGREACEKKWATVRQEDRIKIMEHVPAYIASTIDPKFRKDPKTYLNGKHWNDEILYTVKDGNKFTDNAKQFIERGLEKQATTQAG